MVGAGLELLVLLPPSLEYWDYRPTSAHATFLLTVFLKNATSSQELSIVLISLDEAEVTFERRTICVVTGSALLCFSCCDRHHDLGVYVLHITPFLEGSQGRKASRGLALIGSHRTKSSRPGVLEESCSLTCF